MQPDVKLIVPAAGNGSRMGLPYPKALFHIKGYPILTYILQACVGLVSSGVVVTSPSGDGQITEFLKSWDSYTMYTIIQEKPIGMADAVWTGLKFFSPASDCDYLIVWGDQVTVQKRTIQKVLEHHRKHQNWMTFPTSYRDNPYIHVQRDVNNNVIGILEKREGDKMPPIGESDCGVFVVMGEALNSGLEELKTKTYSPETGKYLRLQGTPSGTGEFNFLPLITMWAQAGRPVEALPLASSDETLGINTRDDAAIAESGLHGLK